MNVHYYNVFVKVYENMSMSIAAEKLFISQPAVSRIIKELEARYKKQLFLRQSNKLFVTQSGRILYHYAKRTLDLMQQLDAEMIKQKTRLKVKMGSTSNISSYLAPLLLSKYKEDCNELDILIASHNTRVIEKQLLDATLDFAILEGRPRSKDIYQIPLFDEKIIFVQKKSVTTVKEIISPSQDTEKQKLRLLVCETGRISEHELEEALYNAGLDYVIQGRFSDCEGIKRCAQQGLGIGVIPRCSLRESDELKEILIPQVQLTNSIYLAYHKEKFVFPQLNGLLNYIKTHAKRFHSFD